MTVGDWINLLIAAATGFAACQAAKAAGIAEKSQYSSAHEAQEAREASRVQSLQRLLIDQMEACLTSYTEILWTHGRRGLPYVAYRPDQLNLQHDARIAIGRLLAVAETMNLLEDSRAETWASFLKGAQGTAARHRLEARLAREYTVGRGEG